MVGQVDIHPIGIAGVQTQKTVIRVKTGQRGGLDQLLESKFLCLHQKFGGGHFLSAEGIPKP